MEARSGRLRGFLRRAPLLLLLAAGLWVWKGGGAYFPVERQIVFLIPGDRSTVRELELQLYDEGALLKRELLSVPSGLSLDPLQKVPLRQGAYQARVFVRRANGALETYGPVVEVLDGDSVLVQVGPRPSSVDLPKDGGI